MKKRTKFIAASLSALIVISGIGVGASIPVGGVTKVNYQFIVNEEKLNLPPYLTVMSKDNATYVPIRFLSENMGLKVDYLPGTVRISSDEFSATSTDQTKNKIAELEKEVKTLKAENDLLKRQIDASNAVIAFRPIPTYLEDGRGFRTTVTDFRQDTTTKGKMSVSISNTDVYNTYYLDPFATELIVDGKTYKTTLDTGSNLSTNLNPNNAIVGAITFDGIDNTKVKGVVKFYYKVNNVDEKTMEIFFDNTK